MMWNQVADAIHNFWYYTISFSSTNPNMIKCSTNIDECQRLYQTRSHHVMTDAMSCETPCMRWRDQRVYSRKQPLLHLPAMAIESPVAPKCSIAVAAPERRLCVDTSAGEEPPATAAAFRASAIADRVSIAVLFSAKGTVIKGEDGEILSTVTENQLTRAVTMHRSEPLQ